MSSKPTSAPVAMVPNTPSPTDMPTISPTNSPITPMPSKKPSSGEPSASPSQTPSKSPITPSRHTFTNHVRFPDNINLESSIETYKLSLVNSFSAYDFTVEFSAAVIVSASRRQLNDAILYLVTSVLLFEGDSNRDAFMEFLNTSPTEANSLLEANLQFQFNSNEISSLTLGDSSGPIYSTTTTAPSSSSNSKEIDMNDVENIYTFGIGALGILLICICMYCLCASKVEDKSFSKKDVEDYTLPEPSAPAGIEMQKKIKPDPTDSRLEGFITPQTKMMVSSYRSISTSDELVPMGTHVDTKTLQIEGDGEKRDPSEGHTSLNPQTLAAHNERQPSGNPGKLGSAQRLASARSINSEEMEGLWTPSGPGAFDNFPTSDSLQL